LYAARKGVGNLASPRSCLLGHLILNGSLDYAAEKDGKQCN
jgi:hypothetical protein